MTTEAPEDELPEPSTDTPAEGEASVLSSFWQREPALVIGSLVTIAVNVVGVLLNEGAISDVVAGRATDLATTLGSFVVALLPIITAALIRPKVSPAV